MSRSIVLLSGGLDSAANLALSVLRDSVVLAVTANYGQRSAEAEMRAARAFCAHYGVKHQVVDLKFLGELGGSSLTDESQKMPDLPASELDNQAQAEISARSVWVPNRNGVLINVAAAFADRLKAEQVIVGFNREEAVTFPDNSADYLDRCTRALELSTSNRVKLVCYTTELDKTQIVRLLEARDPSFPFGLVWSCYEGGTEPCQKCESCRRLARARSTRKIIS